jgi:hypothetical protein
MQFDLDLDLDAVEGGMKRVAGTPFQTARMAAVASATGSDTVFTTKDASAVERTQHD